MQFIVDYCGLSHSVYCLIDLSLMKENVFSFRQALGFIRHLLCFVSIDNSCMHCLELCCVPSVFFGKDLRF